MSNLILSSYNSVLLSKIIIRRTVVLIKYKLTIHRIFKMSTYHSVQMSKMSIRRIGLLKISQNT